jgi:hypothetical protein
MTGLVSFGPAGWASLASGVAAFGLWHLLRQLLRESGGDSALRVRRRKVEVSDGQADEVESAGGYPMVEGPQARHTSGDDDEEQAV